MIIDEICFDAWHDDRVGRTSIACELVFVDEPSPIVLETQPSMTTD